MAMFPAPPTLALVGGPRDDYITHVRYDVFGRRLATVSADGVLRIRDIDHNGTWSVQDGCELKSTHAGTVWKVDWADPDFGQLLATCAQDRNVRIWEEHSMIAADSERNRMLRGTPRWHCVASISESRCGVSDVKFAPRHLGLRIAAASEDGNVRIYKAADPSYLATWLQGQSFVPCAASSSVSCVSWCPCPFERPLLAVGTMSGFVQIWANAGTNDDFGEWTKLLELPGHDGRAVSCVDWADPLGRSFHRIASCGADGQLQVHQVTSTRKLQGGEWRHDSSQQLHDGKKDEIAARAWQAHWNSSGTSLTTSGHDGAVRMWGTDYDGRWSCYDTLYEARVEKKPASSGEMPPAIAPPPPAAAIEEG